MHERHFFSLVAVFSSWLHIASRLQGSLQQVGLWQPLLLSLLQGPWHCIVDIYRCSISNLLCCVDAGRGIQGRSDSQRWQDAQLQLGYHCRCGQPGVAEGQGLEGWQADTPASGTYSTAFVLVNALQAALKMVHALYEAFFQCCEGVLCLVSSLQKNSNLFKVDGYHLPGRHVSTCLIVCECVNVYLSVCVCLSVSVSVCLTVHLFVHDWQAWCHSLVCTAESRT